MSVSVKYCLSSDRRVSGSMTNTFLDVTHRLSFSLPFRADVWTTTSDSNMVIASEIRIPDAANKLHSSLSRRFGALLIKSFAKSNGKVLWSPPNSSETMISGDLLLGFRWACFIFFIPPFTQAANHELCLTARLTDSAGSTLPNCVKSPEPATVLVLPM